MDRLPNDGELLKRFARAAEDAPFQDLLHRHGQMVFQVCFRVLDNSADAEDAAQAVFLTLAQRAKDYALQNSASLGGWLHTLAWRVAQRLRVTASARRKHEQEARAVNSSNAKGSAAQEFHWEQLRPMLDEALASLPEKYRLPFVLYHLEERSQEEVAALLATPPRTLTWRLERARKLLRNGLEKRGLAFSVGILAALTATSVSGGELSATFVLSTVKAASLAFTGNLAVGGMLTGQAAALMQHASRIVLWAKLKAAALILLAAGLVAATGATAYRTFAVQPSSRAGPVAKAQTEASPFPIQNPGEKPDDKPTAYPALAITPCSGDAWRVFTELADKGVKVVQLGRQSILSVPLEMRFKPIAGRELVQSVAAVRKLKVAWLRKGMVAVLYPGASDDEVERARKDLESTDAAVRRNASWRTGSLRDIRAIPLLFKALKDADAEVARLGLAGLRRMSWGNDQEAELLASDADSRVDQARGGEAAARFQINSGKGWQSLETALASEVEDERMGAQFEVFDLRGESALPLLEKLARKGSSERGSAVHALGFMRGEKAFALVESALDDPEQGTRVYAVGALGRIGGEKVQTRLELLLTDKDDKIREESACALGSLDTAQGREWLEKSLVSNDRSIRRGATRALGNLNGEQVLAWIERALSDPDAIVRGNAAASLGNPGVYRRPPYGCISRNVNPEKFLALLEKVLADPEKEVRWSAPSALGDFGGERAAALLEKALVDRDAGVRSLAIDALRYVGTENVPALLEKKLTDTTIMPSCGRPVSTTAASTLAQLGGANALACLENALVHPDAQLRKIVADAIEGADDEIVLPLLQKAFASNDAQIRETAVKSAHRASGPQALVLLDKALSDPDEDVRRTACRSLESVDGEQALLLLEETLVHDSNVRAAAAFSLGKIGGQTAQAILERAFASNNPDVRSDSVLGISLLGGDYALAWIDKSLSDPDAKVRGAAASSIQYLGGEFNGLPYALKESKEKVVALVVKALGSPDAVVRSEATTVLDSFIFHDALRPECLPLIGIEKLSGFLEKGLADPDAGVRRSATDAAHYFNAEQAVPLLQKAMSDVYGKVRAEAAHSLGELGAHDTPDSNEPLTDAGLRALSLLEKGLADTDLDVRRNSVESLPRYSGEKSWRLLEQAFGDPNEKVRGAVATTAERQGGAKALPLLQKAIADPSAYVRGAAARPLGKIGGDNACVSLLAALKTEQDRDVQDRIVNALKTYFPEVPGVPEALKNMPQLPKKQTKPVKLPTAPPNEQF